MNTPLAINLSEGERRTLAKFLGAVRYGDVYKQHFVASWGDGNKAGSAGDVETREILRVLESVYFQTVTHPLKPFSGNPAGQNEPK